MNLVTFVENPFSNDEDPLKSHLLTKAASHHASDALFALLRIDNDKESIPHIQTESQRHIKHWLSIWLVIKSRERIIYAKYASV